MSSNEQYRGRSSGRAKRVKTGAAKPPYYSSPIHSSTFTHRTSAPLSSQTSTTMAPTDDYKSAIVPGAGALKLKGAKDAGISKHHHKKKKKKKKAKTDPTADKKPDAESALEDAEDEKAGPKQHSGAGKTETERKHEETRRKRVSRIFLGSVSDR